jgi:hypothetical protein
VRNRFCLPGWLLCLVLLVTLAAPACRSTPVLQERVLPRPHFVTTVTRAPIAWTRSTGAGVRVAVTRNHDEDLALVHLIAPDVTVESLKVDEEMRVAGRPLADLLSLRSIRILVIVEPGDFDAQALCECARAATRAGVAVFVTGDLGEEEEGVDAELVNDLAAAGAITVGRLDRAGRVRGPDLARRQIDLFAPYGVTFDRGAVLTAAGVGALVLAAEPSLTPERLKERLIHTADAMYQTSNPETGAWSPQGLHVDPKTGDYSPTKQAFHLRRVNAARAVGVHLDVRWPVEALNAPAAWKSATGQGVKVAVLDQGFHVENPAFEDHLVDRAAFFPGRGFAGYQNFHGTAMAKIVLALAPDASLVFLHHSNEYGQMEAVTKAYADAIDYAIATGVDVITSSAAPWPNTPEVHAAIDRAIAAGVVFVWFHYHGLNEAVIRPGFFWDPRWEVGAFDRFFEDDKPSDLEGGFSCTAPQIAGIAALILQNEPDLSPAEVKRRILETATVLPDGNSIADAAAAVENRPSGRQIPARNGLPAPGGQCRMVYQEPGVEGQISIEVKEEGRHWPVPIWPHRDILLYPLRPPSLSTGGSRSGTFQVEVYQDGDVRLTAELPGRQLRSGESSARVSLLPDRWRGGFYSATLGEGDVPPLHVKVDGDRVRLWWESAAGVPMERARRSREGIPPSYRLYRFEVETQLLPELVQTMY